MKRKTSETNRWGLGDWHGINAIPGAAVATVPAAYQSLAVPRGAPREGAGERWGVSRGEYFPGFHGKACSCGCPRARQELGRAGPSRERGKALGHGATATPPNPVPAASG